MELANLRNVLPLNVLFHRGFEFDKVFISEKFLRSAIHAII